MLCWRKHYCVEYVKRNWVSHKDSKTKIFPYVRILPWTRMGSGGKDPRVLNLGARCKWTVIVTQQSRFFPLGLPSEQWIGCDAMLTLQTCIAWTGRHQALTATHMCSKCVCEVQCILIPSRRSEVVDTLRCMPVWASNSETLAVRAPDTTTCTRIVASNQQRCDGTGDRSRPSVPLSATTPCEDLIQISRYNKYPPDDAWS
jgi:hypothetical protein